LTVSSSGRLHVDGEKAAGRRRVSRRLVFDSHRLIVVDQAVAARLMLLFDVMLCFVLSLAVGKFSLLLFKFEFRLLDLKVLTSLVMCEIRVLLRDLNFDQLLLAL
jgi:hypothetical protein